MQQLFITVTGVEIDAEKLWDCWRSIIDPYVLSDVFPGEGTNYLQVIVLTTSNRSPIVALGEVVSALKLDPNNVGISSSFTQNHPFFFN